MTRVFGGRGKEATLSLPPPVTVDAEQEATLAEKLRRMIDILAGTGNGDGDNAIHVDLLSELLDNPATFRVESVL